MTDRLIFGYFSNAVDINEELKIAQSQKMDFISIPLFHPRFRRDSIGISNDRIGPGTRSDMLLESKDWISSIAGRVSDWIDADSNYPHIAKSSELVLKQEFALASHLGLQAIILPTPSLISTNYARIISQLCSSSSIYQYVWVTIPLTTVISSRNINQQTIINSYSNNYKSNNNNSIEDSENYTDGWQVWDYFRHITNHNHRLCVALEMTEDSEQPYPLELMKRWTGEPIKAIIIPTKLFIPNSKGYPVLSKHMQALVSVLLTYKIQIIFKGKPYNMPSLYPYIQYLQHLKEKSMKVLTDGERFCASYKDTLQCPLQPLMDNLESQTYETFERDPVKYERYQEAIKLALIDLHKRDEVAGVVNTYIVNVVGAGRGPLVACAQNASKQVGIPIKINAIEKNANAVVTLRNRVLTEMWSNVTIIATDMRKWNPTELADIMVSELLGSWGDNELSPECLDGAQICLKPNGISIPVSYTSFIAPVCSAKLWMGARDLLNGNGLDSPYVVKFHNSYQIAEAKPLFLFEHPNLTLPKERIDNSRYVSITFDIAVNCTIHGFSGSFESVLYKDAMISIVPQTHSPEMFSWFPLFIPLTVPLRLKSGDVLCANFWRCNNDHKVWYEWNLTSPIVTSLQNVEGKTYWIGL